MATAPTREVHLAVQRVLRPRKFRKAMASPLPRLEKSDGTVCRDAYEVTETWREHFRVLEGGVRSSAHDLVSRCRSAPCELEDQVAITADQLPSWFALEAALRHSAPRKSVGPDLLPPSICRYFSPQLTELFWPLLLKTVCRAREPAGLKGGVLFHIDKGKPGLIMNHWSAHALPLQLGGRPGLSSTFGHLASRSVLSFARRNQLSAGLIFVDLASAYYAVIRETILGKGLADRPISEIASELGMDDTDLQHLRHLIEQEPIMHQQGASHFLTTLAREMHRHTWFVLSDDTELIATQRGTRPGGTLADVLFNILFGRVLVRRQSSTLAGVFPRVPWDGVRTPFPGDLSKAPTTLVTDIVYADDLCTPVVCESASDLRCTISAVTADTFDVLTPHALRPNLGPTKTSALVSPIGSMSRKVRHHLFVSLKGKVPIWPDGKGLLWMDLVWALLAWNPEFQQGLRSSGEWFYEAMHATCKLGRIHEDWFSWSTFLKCHPGHWKGLLKRAEAWDIEIHRLQGIFESAARTLWSPSTPSVSLPIEGMRHACLICGLAFASRQQWGAHAQRVHGYRNAASRLVVGRQCQACGTVYATGSRLKTHLLASARCRAFLELSDPASLPAPLPESKEPILQAPSVRAASAHALPPAGEELCLALAEDLARLQAASDQDIYDVVASHLAPLPVLRRTLEVWACGLPAGPLADSAADVLLVLTPGLLCSAVCGKSADPVEVSPFVPQLKPLVFRPRSSPSEVLWHGHLDSEWLARWHLSSLPARHVDFKELQVHETSCAGLCFALPPPPCQDACLLSPGSKPLRDLRALIAWIAELLDLLRILLRSAQAGIPVLFRVNVGAAQLSPLSSCPVECIDGYSFTGSVTCTMGSYVVDALGCVRDSVATMPTTVLGADLTVVSAATNNSDDQSIAVVSMTSSLVLDPTVSPEDLGSHVAVDLLATNRSSPLNATLAVWNAALSSELLPIQAIKAAVSAGLAVGAPVAAFSALAELALSSLSVKEIITGITQGVLMSVNDTARLTGILSAALDGVSSTALMQSMSDPVGSRRLATDTPASRMGDTVAEMASSIGGQLPTQVTAHCGESLALRSGFPKGHPVFMRCGGSFLSFVSLAYPRLGIIASETSARKGLLCSKDITTACDMSEQMPEISVELSRIHDGALLAGQSLLFADTAVAYAQMRWLGLPLSQLSTARQGLASIIRQAAESAYAAGTSIASRSGSLLDLARQMGTTFANVHPDRGAAAAHSLGLEFGLSPVEALQLAAATAFHLHVGRCADTAFRCLPWRLIAIRDAGRSMANLLRWRSGPHTLEAGHMALLAAAAAESSLSLEADLEAKLAAAAGAMSVFGLTEQDMSLHAPTLAAADVPMDVARSAWMLGMSEKADRVVQILQGTTEVGAALAIRLGEDLMSEVSPWEGRLAVEWAMRTAGNSERSSRSAAAMSAALLAGGTSGKGRLSTRLRATAGDLLGALNNANMAGAPDSRVALGLTQMQMLSIAIMRLQIMMVVITRTADTGNFDGSTLRRQAMEEREMKGCDLPARSPPHASPAFLRMLPDREPTGASVGDGDANTTSFVSLRADIKKIHNLQLEMNTALEQVRLDMINVKRPLLHELQKLSNRLQAEPGFFKPSVGGWSESPTSAHSKDSLDASPCRHVPSSPTKVLLPEVAEDEAPKVQIAAVAKRSATSEMPRRRAWKTRVQQGVRNALADLSYDLDSSGNSGGFWLGCAALFLSIVPSLTIVVNAAGASARIVIGLQSDIQPDFIVWDILEWPVLKLCFLGFGVYFCGQARQRRLCIVCGFSSFLFAGGLFLGFFDHWTMLVHVHQKDYKWNLFDSFCLLISYVDLSIYYTILMAQSSENQSNLNSLMLIKMFRLGRLVRLIRLVRHRMFYELKVMIYGLWAGIRVLGWAITVLFVLVYTFGVILRNIMGDSFPELETVPAAMFTLFRCFTEDCAAYDGTPLPERVRMSPVYGGGAFLISYILMIMIVSVGVFNLIMAIFIDNVTGSQQARRNRELAETADRVRVTIKEHVARFLGKDMQKRMTFIHGDLNTRRDLLDEQLNQQEVVIRRESFQRWLQDPEFTEARLGCRTGGSEKEWAWARDHMLTLLEEAYIDVSNKGHLFDIMDADMGGNLSLDELVDGLMALRGTVNKGDIINMSLKIRLLTRHVERLLTIQEKLAPGEFLEG
ncbi:unnamed protein product [Symbiodinium microadriaticum]|nr:unnamed protein product [Symbiodinium microadriaticum]